MNQAAAVLQRLWLGAEELGQSYIDAVKCEDHGRALACAQQMLARVAEAIPSGHYGAQTLLFNMVMALQEVGAGKFDNHPILKGRHKLGGIGQLSAAAEYRNGIGAAVMLFLMERKISEHAAAALVSSALGIGTTAAKNLTTPKKRKLLNLHTASMLELIQINYAATSGGPPLPFAKQWIRSALDWMDTVSPC